MTTFPATLTRLRESAGLSQQGLARHAGFDTSYVCRLEMGADNPNQRTPTRAAVGRLADALALGPYHRVELYHAAGFVCPDARYTVETGQVVTIAVGAGRDGAREQGGKREAAA